jgi:hypothetical protein
MIGFGAIHDPEGRLLDLSRSLLPEISGLFTGLVFAVSTQTVPEYQELNSIRGMAVSEFGEAEGFAQRRKAALQKALELPPDSAYWCLDPDKLFHWYETDRDDLISHIKSVPDGLVLMGRNQAAWDTYPDSWKNTESLVNHLANQVFGTKNWDFYTGELCMDRNTAQMLALKSQKTDVAQLLEWDHLAKINTKLSYRTFAGLTWEDPDRFRAEIKKLGYANWHSQYYDSLKEWQRRIHNLVVGVNYLQQIASQT